MVDIVVHENSLGVLFIIWQGTWRRLGFPPLRSLGNPALANNLPAQLASLIGRDRERAKVGALVKSSRWSR
jgi:hypothetical protein